MNVIDAAVADLGLPATIECAGTLITLKYVTNGDADSIIAFANSLATHDLLFLRRDIRNPKVVAAWIDQHNKGLLRTIIAERDGEIIGSVALARDELSWSMHVGDIRLLVSPAARGTGIARVLLEEVMALATSMDVIKLTASMTPDQQGAIALFEDQGFAPEALLRDHVRDPDGSLHDLVVFSLNLERAGAHRTAYGSPGD